MRSRFRKNYDYIRYPAPVYDDSTGEDVQPEPLKLSDMFSIQPAKPDEAMEVRATVEGVQQSELFRVYTSALLEPQRIENGRLCRADEIIYAIGSRVMRLRVVKLMPYTNTRLRHNKLYAQAVEVEEHKKSGGA